MRITDQFLFCLSMIQWFQSLEIITGSLLCWRCFLMADPFAATSFNRNRLGQLVLVFVLIFLDEVMREKHNKL
jgi:hypothetical protein